jgi:hypothetical protein
MAIIAALMALAAVAAVGYDTGVVLRRSLYENARQSRFFLPMHMLSVRLALADDRPRPCLGQRTEKRSRFT